MMLAEQSCVNRGTILILKQPVSILNQKESRQRKDLLKKCNNFFVEVNRYSETNLRVLAINERFKSIIELANGISRIVYDDRNEGKNL